MSEDDVLFGYRLRLFALAGEIGVRAACRTMGVHHSTYYRWAEKVDRWGLEALAAAGAAAAADAERARPAPGAADPRLLARPPRARAQADQRRARAGEVGRPQDLPERRLAGA